MTVVSTLPLTSLYCRGKYDRSPGAICGRAALQFCTDDCRVK